MPEIQNIFKGNLRCGGGHANDPTVSKGFKHEGEDTSEERNEEALSAFNIGGVR